MTDCLFCKIVSREIPAEIVYENDHLLAFRDIEPQAPTHILIIPKQHVATLLDLPADDKRLLGRLQHAALEIARTEGLTKGFRLVMNCMDEGGQSVFHIHLHLLGGRQMKWPPG